MLLPCGAGDCEVGVDDAVMLLEPEPHIPDNPDVSNIPEDVDSPDVAEMADDIDNPDVPEVADMPDVAGVPDIAGVEGVVVPVAIPPPS